MPVKDPTENLTYYNEEMEDCANSYAAFIIELVEMAKQTYSDPMVLIEQQLDFSKYVLDGFGTGDCVIISDCTLHIVDYTHGQGVLVDAENNPQITVLPLSLDGVGAVLGLEKQKLKEGKELIRYATINTPTSSAATGIPQPFIDTTVLEAKILKQIKWVSI